MLSYGFRGIFYIADHHFLVTFSYLALQNQQLSRVEAREWKSGD